MGEPPKWTREKKLEYIFRHADAEQVFTRIFETNMWDGGDSPSGSGSTLELTENLRNQLPALIDQFAIKSIFDAPCGDFNWMKVFLAGHPIDYLGADIVKPLIDLNNANYGNARTKFIHFDISTGDFPKADMWLCRDCLFHLSFEEIFRALKRFAVSDIRYILTTTHIHEGAFNNYDISTGHYRPIDLFAAPFGFDRAPLFRIDDYVDGFPPREMCLWSREQIISALK